MDFRVDKTVYPAVRAAIKVYDHTGSDCESSESLPRSARKLPLYELNNKSYLKPTRASRGWVNLARRSVAVPSASPEPFLRNKDLVTKPLARKRSVESVRKVPKLPLDQLNKMSYLGETAASKRWKNNKKEVNEPKTFRPTGYRNRAWEKQTNYMVNKKFIGKEVEKTKIPDLLELRDKMK